MRRARAWMLAAVVTGVGAPACSGTNPPQAVLLASGAWNANPSTVAEIGYQVGADVGWPDRVQSCFDLSPTLTININDVAVNPTFYGDCRFDVLVYSGAFQQDVPITIKLEDGNEVLAQADIEGLFPGAAAQLVSPAGGQAHAGDPIVVTMPVSVVSGSATYAEFYWLDMPSGAPPFNTFATGTLSADGSTFQTTAPSITGPAALVLKGVFDTPSSIAASTCTGFGSCSAEPDTETIGPLMVDIVP